MKANTSPSDNARLARRRFLQRLGLLAAGATAAVIVTQLGANTVSSKNGASSDKRWGLLIDSEKCSAGCDACVSACNDEHGLTDTGRDDTDAQWIRKIELKDNLTDRHSSLPMMCQHCDSAPCVDVCPTGASFKRADGIVLVNKHTCIGCRYCIMACPYKARSFIHETLSEQKSWAPRGKGTVESCTLCVHRVDAESTQTTACAEACAAKAKGAILFGDLNDPSSEISQAMATQSTIQVRSDLELNTGVRYTQL